MPSSAITKRRVILLTWSSTLSIEGWSRFAAARRWQIELLAPNGQAVEAIAKGAPDGVIAYLGSDAFNRWAAEQSFPVVNHSSSLAESSVPRVCIDDFAAGQLAADHLLDLGHRVLAYIGFSSPWFSAQREAGFIERAAEAGASVRVHRVRVALEPVERQRSPRRHEGLVRFLSSLPKPAGVFTCNDPLGQWAIAAAADAGRSVPDDTAVLGMDDDAMCQLAHPPLSSIVSPFAQVAYRSAQMLEAMLAGEQPSDTDVRVPPHRIEARQSTDALAIDDAKTAAAVRYMRDHFEQPIQIDEVARAVRAGRRTLEVRFRQYFGRTPLQELHRLRLQAAKQMLEDPRLTLPQVAERSGFESYQWFSSFFTREVGVTPKQYRLQVQ